MLYADYSIYNASFITTTYYETIIEAVRNIMHFRTYPLDPKTKMYCSMIIKEETLVEFKYPTINWNNQKLFMIKLLNSNKCNKCTSDEEQILIHIFYECHEIKSIYMWLLRVLLYISDFTLI